MKLNLNVLFQNGYDVLTVWEQNIMKIKKRLYKKCIEFLISDYEKSFLKKLYYP